jgi:hypothetical protein
MATQQMTPMFDWFAQHQRQVSTMDVCSKFIDPAGHK